MNQELPDVKLHFKRQRNQRSNCQHPSNDRKSKRISKTIYFCFIDYVKAFDGVDHNKLENSSDHLATATAKSLQLCPTLYNPIDGSPPGSPGPGILQARTLEWVAVAFSNA